MKKLIYFFTILTFCNCSLQKKNQTFLSSSERLAFILQTDSSLFYSNDLFYHKPIPADLIDFVGENSQDSCRGFALNSSIMKGEILSGKVRDRCKDVCVEGYTLGFNPCSCVSNKSVNFRQIDLNSLSKEYLSSFNFEEISFYDSRVDLEKFLGNVIKTDSLEYMDGFNTRIANEVLHLRGDKLPNLTRFSFWSAMRHSIMLKKIVLSGNFKKLTFFEFAYPIELDIQNASFEQNTVVVIIDKEREVILKE
jgi:hypothetical protein